RDIEYEEKRTSVAELRDHDLEPLRSLPNVEIGDRGRQEQKSGREDRRNHARRIELDDEIRLSLDHAHSDMTARIDDEEPSLRKHSKNEQAGQTDCQADHAKDLPGRYVALATEFEHGSG